MYALKQRVHPTWLLTVLCIGLLAGVALARYVPPQSFLLALAGATAVVFGFWRRHAWLLVLVAMGGTMIGVWRGGLEMQGLAAYQSIVGTTATITGTVNADPQSAKANRQGLSMTDVTIAGHSLPGTVYVAVADTPLLRRDDRVTVTGKVTAGYSNYAATMYQASLQQVARPHNIFLDLRDRFSAAVRVVIAEPMASLGIGFLVGQKTALPSDFSDALKIAGLTHIVVASGYNLTILVRLVRRLFQKISKYQVAFWSIALIIGFMAITGWSASMTRAGLVAGLSLWAWYYGRKFHPVTLLAVAASITVLVHPPYVWGDIGWALSFAAFSGVIVLAPLLIAYFYGNTKPRFVARIIIETGSAQLVTLPIMLGVFGQFSVVALLSNVMVLTLVPYAMALVFVAGVGQLIMPVITPIIAWPAQLLLGYMVWAVNWTASMPWAQVKWQLPVWGVVLSYLGIGALCIYLQRVTGYQLRNVNLIDE